MDIQSIEQLTGLDARELKPKDRYSFLRCQLGKSTTREVKMRGGRCVDRLFHLRYFGATWDEVQEQWEAKQFKMFVNPAEESK